ncbi:MAG: CHRD domain-containing protein [Bacteroidota bacterium]
MKQLFNSLTKTSVFASLVLATSLLFSSCAKDSGYVSASVTYSLSGNASGSQAVPASSNSNGSGTFSGTYNSSTKVMTYTSSWSNLTGAPVSGGLYSGLAGQVGSSIAVWSLGGGLGASGSFSTSTTLNADQEAKLLSGQTYYILSTTANASGEIRGQISASAQ